MLVPIELHILASQRGYLSPELALGWQIGNYVREFFDDLEDVRIAAGEDGDAAYGLSLMCRKIQFPFPVTIAQKPRPWTVLVYHHLTGTTLSFHAIKSMVEMPEEAQDLEVCFNEEDRGIKGCAVGSYSSEVNGLVHRILSNPLEDFCKIVESRLRFLGIQDKGEKTDIRCRVCGYSFQKNKLVDSNGVICCPACAGLEPSWFEWM